MHGIARDWRNVTLADPDRSLCELAAKLTHNQSAMSPSDLDCLRRTGFSEAAILDAVQIISYFNYITRVADALGLEPEEFIETNWGSEWQPE